MYNKLIVALVTQALKGIMIGMQRLSFVLCVSLLLLFFIFSPKVLIIPLGLRCRTRLCHQPGVNGPYP